MKPEYYILKKDDIGKYLTPWYQRTLRGAARRIAAMREEEGKQAVNEYLVVNTDENWIAAMYEAMRKSGVKVEM